MLYASLSVSIALKILINNRTLTGTEQPIAFLSQKFSLAAKNCHIHEKEASPYFPMVVN